ncbi:flagellar assembly protein T N-terminal domain-containing protein [Zoogloea sp.]|uniref:flagellar assembly protein T N-terminal domain-containing protein n=1 Tax=Zoogloea sp. TaxID=49181 RepID=UPI0025F47DE4|nr:flagellar assembly protein T N-terminal domain-containing protein [Zoogloea sp.]MCK6392981.1 flagellar assembly protein T N-terminal domain-containing protein [Zoogloea sp.]
MGRHLLHHLPVFALLLAAAGVSAEPVITTGSAPIHGERTAAAREEAIRNALADASRQSALQVEARLGTSGQAMAFDQVMVRSSGRVQQHRILQEGVQGDHYQVTLGVELASDAPSPFDQPACRESHAKRVLIIGFPVSHPEHLKFNELSGYAQLTAGELARRLYGGKLLADHDGDLMLGSSAPERVGTAPPPEQQAWHLIRQAARKHRAQYLITGHFRSLSASADETRRELDLDVQILDASTGSCVARRRFTHSARGRVRVPESTVFGSPGHYASAFGQAYAAALDEMAEWTRRSISCLPFSARVLKVEGERIYLDSGAEQGLSAGDTFSAFKPAPRPVLSSDGETLGVEKTALGELVITTVYPRFAIAERRDAASAQPVEAGDEAHEH